MLHGMISVLLAGIAIGMVGVLMWSIVREYLRYKRRVAATSLPAHPLDSHVTAILHIQDGQILRIEKPAPQPTFVPNGSIYTRRRMFVSLCLLLMFSLGLFAQSGLAGGTIETFSRNLEISVLSLNGLGDVLTAAHQKPLVKTEAKPVVSIPRIFKRIDSSDRSQYYTNYQWQVWSYSSCSGISMTVVMNYYGRKVIAADVLQREFDLGVWSEDLGILRDEGFAMTASTFGFTADSGYKRSLADIIALANQGTPVIVAIRDAERFPGGHIIVVAGGDSQVVRVVDSSIFNLQTVTHAEFLSIWQGFSSVMVPVR